MRLGVDFDNTIVCYDELFRRVALETGLLPEAVPANKSDIRNHFRRIGREEVWTELQGLVYGPRIAEADPYPGVIEFFRKCREAGVPVSIISHKTRHPFRGERHDLHAAALRWLEKHGFFDPAGIGLPRDRVYLELTREAKLERIASTGCTHFIDDLPEFLGEAGFPGGVHRILFDPHQLHTNENRYSRMESWADAGLHLDFTERIEKAAAAGQVTNGDAAWWRVLGRKVVASGRVVLAPLPGGANNRVRHLQVGDESCVLKTYFRNLQDPRDRFAAEKSFYTWAWAHGVRRIPEPLGWDVFGRWGLFRFVSGQKVESPSGVTRERIEQAMDFIAEVNRDRADEIAQSLPTASEACFSVAEHLECVDRRVSRVAELPGEGEVECMAREFVHSELRPAWEKTREAVRRRSGNSIKAALSVEQRCLSPSDFGFHNAVVRPDGSACFFDFEYAGWDDPAKLVCDFFCQPRVPVALEYWDLVVSRVASLFAESNVAERAALLLPVYQIKWCCILLNEFLRGDRARREFAEGTDAGQARQREQLAKARQMLKRVEVAG